MKVLFYSAANHRQDEIWDYTVKEWGEEKAIQYMEELTKLSLKLPQVLS